jgi:osmoprotectant transport system permease protein
MGVGCLGLLTGSYILIINGFQKGAAFGMLRYAMVFSSLAAVVILLGTGHLNELSVLKEFAVRKDRFFQELGLHVQLAGTAVLLGVIIGTPLGMWAFRSRLFERPIFFVVNSIQTIPSLALFGLMIAPLSVLSNRFPVLRQMGVKGIGGAPALIALTLYALLPITRNTYTSLSVVEPSILEAARGMGMNRMQLLRNIQVPLSLPIILSGIRISMVQAIGNTTVAALIGAGGFGVFVFQGLGQAASDLILLGTIPVIALAVFTDRIMQFLVTVLTPEGIRRAGESVR